MIQIYAMNLLAITNASELIKKHDNKVINIGLKNNHIIALGYLPDDEEFNEINAKHSVIIENTFNLIDGFKSQKKEENDGISACSDFYNAFKFTETYNFLKNFKNLNYDKTKIYVVYTSLSELLFLIQESSNLPKEITFHFLVEATNESLSTIKTLSLNSNISIGLVINDTINFNEIDMKDLFKNNQVVTLSSKQTNKLLPVTLELFYKNTPEIIHNIFNPFFLKKANKKQLLLGSQPNLTIIEKAFPYKIICTIKKGKIYLSKKEKKNDF